MANEQVRQRIESVHNGKLDQVRAELPNLERLYPNDPGVKFIDAYTTRDGVSAMKKYQAIVDQFPKSEWADNALYRVYQYYYSVGLYKTADQKMAQLQEQYPNSIFANREIKPGKIVEIKPPQQSAVDSQQTEKKEITTSAPTVEQKTEVVQTPVQTSTGQSASPFMVQVGNYSLENTAAMQAKNFSSTVGRTATVFPKRAGDKQVFAVVFEGFVTESDARSFIAELKSNYNIDAFLVKR
jgi:tetratricopeptide (TPR) repeat protein